MKISRIAFWLPFALSTFSFGIADAIGADTQIYKCSQPNGGVLYTDLACKGGTELNIRLGPIDPAASVRLEHAQAELDATAARRTAEEEMAAARREESTRLQLETDSEQATDDPDQPYDSVYAPFGRHPHPRHRPPEHDPHTRHDQPPMNEFGKVGSGRR